MPELKPELLPCPVFDWWCGGTGFLAFRGVNPGRWNVVCDKCGCTGPYGNDQVEAALGWNTRAPSELERLAREVIRFRQEMIDVPNDQANLRVVALLVFDRGIDALAAFLAEPQK